MRSELPGLLFGLEEAIRFGFNKLIVRMDNSACVGMINNDELVSN